MKAVQPMHEFCNALRVESSILAEVYAERGEESSARHHHRRQWCATRLCLILEALERGNLHNAKILVDEELTRSTPALPHDLGNHAQRVRPDKQSA